MSSATAVPNDAWPLALKLPLSVLLSCLTLWTLVGNGLVLAALVSCRQLRSAPNLLIGNLAISDFLLALTVLPLSSVSAVMGHWRFGPVLCNLWLSLDVLYCTASVWSLVAIAFDRFTATVCPLWYREKRHRCRAAAYSILVWLLSCLICLPPLIGWDGREFVDPAEKLGRSLVPVPAGNSSWDGRVTCDLFKETNYVVYSATGSFILPLLILIVLYSRIFHLLRRRARCLRKRRLQQQRHLAGANQPSGVWFDRDLDLATVVPAPTVADNFNHRGDDAEVGDEPCVLANPAVRPPQPYEEEAAATEPMPLHRRGPRRADLREQRATQRMLTIVVVFIVCWMPFTLMYLVRGVTSGQRETASGEQPPQSAALEVVQFLAIWLGYANSALNPVLYTVFNRDFRHAIARLLRRRRRRRRRPQAAGS